MNTISVKSPTRVDLAGGTLDLWPIFAFLGGAKTVNLAISIYTYVELTVLDNPTIEIESEDIKLHKFYTSYAQAIGDSDPMMGIYRNQIEFWKPSFGFKLKTKSESPVGGGLGGSSSLVISLMKAFSKACRKSFATNHALVEAAHNLEARQLMTPTGTQDYYPAITGGLNILEYKDTGIVQEIFTEKDSLDFEEHFLLVYTGRSHHSGMNNFEVLKNAVEKKSNTIRALVAIRQVADEMAVKCRVGQWNDLAPLFVREYESRVQLASAVLSPEITKLKDVALGAGAQAVKICGAGGGGCVMVWCPVGSKVQISKAVIEAGFEVLNAKPVWEI
jgi:D-glycero-alpha-D-manno-heptose-7-phosphate kinase